MIPLDSTFSTPAFTRSCRDNRQRRAPTNRYGLYILGLDFQNFDRRARNEPGLIAQRTADHIKIAAGIMTYISDRAADAMSEHIRNIEEQQAQHE